MPIDPSAAINLASAAYFGLSIGGFATVLLDRLAEPGFARPTTGIRQDLHRLSAPPSSCSCGRRLSTIEKIPLIGLAFSRGRCSGCGSKVSLFYPLTEILVAGAVTAGSFTLTGASILAFNTWIILPVIAFVLGVLLQKIRPRAASIFFALHATALPFIYNLVPGMPETTPLHPIFNPTLILTACAALNLAIAGAAMIRIGLKRAGWAQILIILGASIFCGLTGPLALSLSLALGARLSMARLKGGEMTKSIADADLSNHRR
jgi:prepilin signal peptidase PulO-like enzyme (type II secretory pathway)